MDLELAYLKPMICTFNGVLKLDELAENLGRMILDLSPDYISLYSGLASDPNLRLTCPTCQPCSSASMRPHLFLAATH